MDWILRAIEVAFLGIGGIATIYAAKLWLQAQKYRAITESKDEAIRIARSNADSWKSHYEASHLDQQTYRKEVHDKNNITNERIVKLTEENALLKNKTDLSPILEFHKAQTDVNSKIVGALEVVTRHLEKLLPREKPARLTKKRGT